MADHRQEESAVAADVRAAAAPVAKPLETIVKTIGVIAAMAVLLMVVIANVCINEVKFKSIRPLYRPATLFLSRHARI